MIYMTNMQMTYDCLSKYKIKKYSTKFTSNTNVKCYNCTQRVNNVVLCIFELRRILLNFYIYKFVNIAQWFL